MTPKLIDEKKSKAEKQVYRLVRSHLFNIFQQYNSIARVQGVSVAEMRLNEINRQDFEKIYIEIYNSVGLQFYQLQSASLDKMKIRTPNVGFFSEIWRQIIMNAVRDVRIASLITNITDNTRKHVRNILFNAAAERLAPRQIARLFKDNIPAFVNNRALTIARTETGAAAAIGIEHAAKQSQLQLYTIWYHATHGNSRDNHLALHLKYAKKGERFDMGDGVKMLYPHDYEGGARENINCRCTHSYVTEDVLKEMGL